MKYILLILLPFSALLSCKQNPDSSDKTMTTSVQNEQKELDAIMKVIDAETKCFFDGDYECWKNNWSHQYYAAQSWNNDDGSVDVALGGDKIDAQGKNWIDTYYKKGENIVHPLVKKDKPIVKFFNDNVAYLMWTQYNANKDKSKYRISKESRIMEKEKDGWKIVNVTALWDTKNDIPFDSLKLN